MQRKREDLVSRKGRDFHQEVKEQQFTLLIPVLPIQESSARCSTALHRYKERQERNDPTFQLEKPRQGYERGFQAVSPGCRTMIF